MILKRYALRVCEKVLPVLLSIILISLATCSVVCASVRHFKNDGDGLTFYLDKGIMKVKICKDDIIQVKYTFLNSFPAKHSLVIDNIWIEKTFYTISEKENEIIISTKKIKVKINKANNAITYTDLNDKVILAEDDNNKSMSAVTIAGIDTHNCTTEFNSPGDEALFGLGCHPLDSGSINYKGRDQEMLIKYLTGAIPVLLSTKGYGLLWDNYSASNFYGAEEGNTKYKYVSESGNMIDYYFFYGPDFDHIINLYREATGKAPMFPKWAFGLFQSQDRYKTQEEILSVKDNYRKNRIPVDVIVQDWYWWSPLPIGSHSMNKERYPNPKSMIKQLHDANIHAMISIWPVFGKGTKNFDALKSKGYLTSITWDNFVTHTFDTYYDAHNPKARALYWQQAKDSLIAPVGWDAWWVDQCEPDNGALWDARRQSIFSVGKGIDYFNSYSLEHSKGIYQGWRKDIPNKRAFFLIRQSFAGEQKNAATLWSSDITSTFSSLKNQVPQGINACASGIPYWTSDIGGYLSRVSPEGIPDWSLPQFRELFIRWFQFGTFCPVFRIHGKGERALFSNNWDDKTKNILLHFDNLRYRLLPYIYSLAGKVTTDNYTIMRSLAFDFRNDTSVYNIRDEYMFGPAFLVSPVTEQLYTGDSAGAKEKIRKVYLPKSAAWYNFWTGQSMDGGQTISASVPMETIPLYIKSGAIIPMGPLVEYATQKPNDSIELRIYPGADGEFTFYEDENDNYNYEKGMYATFTIKWNDKNRELTISGTKGKFNGMLKQRIFNVVLVKDNHGTGTDFPRYVDKLIRYNGRMINVNF